MIWSPKILPQDKSITENVSALNVSESIATILSQRNIVGYEDAKTFFRPDLKKLHNPFMMKSMHEAADRVCKAIQHKETILVYGDYDVDGTTSVALVYSYLKNLQLHCLTYIPDRYKEGYGLSTAGIDFAITNQATLIICLDCGIKAIDKVEYANTKNIDIIICDHHRPGKIVPQAVAVLDPKQDDCTYPFKELCGCGIGFKMIQAIQEKLQKPFTELLPYLDLVVTAIGSDIVPITGENRILAHYGLQVLNQNPRIGIKAIIENIQKKHFNITDVVFILGPRINAAGRIKHGLNAVSLLTETDYQQAREKAKEIEKYNSDRRNLDQSITKEALIQIKELNEENKKTSVVYNDTWHKGVIGIVASRLIETYYRPTLVFTKSGNYLAASARSVYGYDIYKALEKCSKYIEQFGGHKYAAGLTLQQENYASFKEEFEKVVQQTIPKDLLVKRQVYDIQLNLKDITPKFYRILQQFAPFGPGNMKPVFRINELQDTGYAKTVGKDNDHLKCKLFKGKDPLKFDAIGFNLGSKITLLQEKKKIDILCTIDENEWNGNISLQLILKDIRQSRTIENTNEDI